jgi:hypothetical protein
MGDLFKAVPSSSHCDGSWWPLGSVASPSSQPSDDPSEPSDRMQGMSILLFSGLALEAGLQSLENRQLLWCNYIGGWSIDSTVARTNELHNFCSRYHGDGSEIGQCLGVFDLTTLKIKTLALAGTEQLLDVPALAIPGDDLQCLSNRLHLMGRYQAPVDRLFDLCIGFSHFDQPQCQLGRSMRIAAIPRPLDRYLAEAQLHLRCARRTSRPRAQFQLKSVLDGPCLGNTKKSPSSHQGTITAGASQKMGALVGNPVKFFVDVALSVSDNRHHCSRGEHALGRLRSLHPTIGFLFLNRLVAIIGSCRTLACPDLNASQSEQCPTGSIHRQHGMNKETRVNSIPARSKSPYSPGMCSVVEFRRVLNGQHMETGHPVRQCLPAMRRKLAHRHVGIIQPATKPYPIGAAIRRCPKIYRNAFGGALQQQRPLLASRASPKRPTDQSMCSIDAALLVVDRKGMNLTRFTHGKKNLWRVMCTP